MLITYCLLWRSLVCVCMCDVMAHAMHLPLSFYYYLSAMSTSQPISLSLAHAHTHTNTYTTQTDKTLYEAAATHFVIKFTQILSQFCLCPKKYHHSINRRLRERMTTTILCDNKNTAIQPHLRYRNPQHDWSHNAMQFLNKKKIMNQNGQIHETTKLDLSKHLSDNVGHKTSKTTTIVRSTKIMKIWQPQQRQQNRYLNPEYLIVNEIYDMETQIEMVILDVLNHLLAK